MQGAAHVQLANLEAQAAVAAPGRRQHPHSGRLGPRARGPRPQTAHARSGGEGRDPGEARELLRQDLEPTVDPDEEEELKAPAQRDDAGSADRGDAQGDGPHGGRKAEEEVGGEGGSGSPRKPDERRARGSRSRSPKVEVDEFGRRRGQGAREASPAQAAGAVDDDAQKREGRRSRGRDGRDRGRGGGDRRGRDDRAGDDGGRDGRGRDEPGRDERQRDGDRRGGGERERDRDRRGRGDRGDRGDRERGDRERGDRERGDRGGDRGGDRADRERDRDRDRDRRPSDRDRFGGDRRR
ncbi:unnamed protein product [Prorocentrum cordatum]|uniref:Uncharacterized protein n=1 Tax=Prorocentrum cordatum TaxID=2364126 RepID=A0ABN9UIN9_9DINO|nr:unnamed protein product [Polarella glacialis]